MEERLTGKYIMVVLDNVILSVLDHEGIIEITSDKSDIYVGEKDKLRKIAIAFGITDLSLLDD